MHYFCDHTVCFSNLQEMRKKWISWLYFVLVPLLACGQSFDFTGVPGTVIAHAPSIAQTYLGTPSIVMLPDGNYVASHGKFGKEKEQITVYRSDDKGVSWEKISELKGFWSGLFVHQEELYLMGVDEQYGNCVIRKSEDGGINWTNPGNEHSGLIRRHDGEKGFHTSAVSIVATNGRLYRPFEVARRDGSWGNFEALVLSASLDANLLDASSWKTSTRMSVDTCWGIAYNTWLEGGAVIAPDGEVVNVLRVDNRIEETAAIMHVSGDGSKLSFNPEHDFIRFPGGCKRFVIRYDPVTERYWSLTNWVPEEFEGHNPERTRNTLALVSSPDLRGWTVHRVVLQDDNVAKSGFQYVDWQTEGEDIIFVSRTAFFDGVYYADNQHNANFITFHRIPAFRSSLTEVITIIEQ